MRSKHHIIPTSIGGPKYNPENIYLGWAGITHYYFHQVFFNRPPSVVIKIIEGFTDENGDWNRKLMSSNDYKYLRRAFGCKQPSEAADFIKREFLPIEEKYLRGELPEHAPPSSKKKTGHRQKRT